MRVVHIAKIDAPKAVEPQTEMQPITAKPSFSRLNQIVQIMIGIGVGSCADYLLQDAGFTVLVRCKVIYLADAFSGIYLPEPPQQILDGGVFVFLIISLVCLRRWTRFRYFATAALTAHCLIGGLYTLVRVALD